MERTMNQKLLAEFVGTFTVVFIAAGAIIQTQGQDLVAIALAYGLAIGVMVSALGHVSGGHFNPAVTIGAWVTQKIDSVGAGSYLVAQLAGGAAAAGLLRACLPSLVWKGQGINLGVPAVSSAISTGQGVLIEAILTFFLVWVIFATAIDPEGSFGKIAGLAIGLTITMDIFMGGAFTGAAMNPARWFGPAIVGGYWKNWWVWLIGPIAGGIIAASLYDTMILRPRGAGGPAEEAPHGWGAHGEDEDSTTGADEGIGHPGHGD
ncbi:MAG: aquaporin [Actinomycetota bacterium]